MASCLRGLHGYAQEGGEGEGVGDAQRLTGFLLQVETPAVAVVKKPNPKNVQNLKEQERLKAHLEG